MKRKYAHVHPAMIAAWAALIAVSGLLPTFPILGTGGTFSVGYALAPIAGIMFGPFAGALAVAIGELLGSVIAPHTAALGIFTFIINTTNAFAAGYISRKNWYVCFGIIAVLQVAWLFTETGQGAMVYSLVYIAGMIMAPVGGIIGTKLFMGGHGIKKAVGVFLMAWPCYIAGSIVGNLLTLALYDIPVDLWSNLLVFLTPIERTVFAIGATIIGTPLLVGLPKIGIYVGPEFDAEEKKDDLDKEMELDNA